MVQSGAMLAGVGEEGECFGGRGEMQPRSLSQGGACGEGADSYSLTLKWLSFGLFVRLEHSDA